MALHNPTLIVAVSALLLTAGCTGGAGKSAREENPESAISSQFAELPVDDIVKAGDQAMQQREFERAHFIYMQALSLDEKDAGLWYRIGRVNTRLGRQKEAWHAYGSALKLDPEHAGAHEKLGLLYMSTKQRESARSYLEKAVVLDPARWRALNALGVLADADGDYGTAIGYYGAALEHQPDSTILLNNLGYSHYLAGNFTLAKQHFRMAIGIDGDNRKAMANLGLVYARTAAYERAVETLARVFEKHQAYNDVGYIAFRNGDHDDAIWLLTQAAETSPTYYVTAYDNLEQVRKSMQAGTTPKPGEPVAVVERPSPPAMPDASDVDVAVVDRVDADAEPDYRHAELGPLTVYAAGNFDAETIGRIDKGDRVIHLFTTNGGWSFIMFGDLAAATPATGWVRSHYLSGSQLASLN